MWDLLTLREINKDRAPEKPHPEMEKILKKMKVAAEAGRHEEAIGLGLALGFLFHFGYFEVEKKTEVPKPERRPKPSVKDF